MLRSRSNTSGYTSYFWKKPWKTGLFVGRREGLSLGVHGLRRGPLLSRPATCHRRGVPVVQRHEPRAGGLSGDDQTLIAIGYLDGNRLSRAVIAGAHFVA